MVAFTAKIIAIDDRNKCWSKVVLQKLMMVLLSKFSSFYGIWRFTLTRTSHLFLFWARWNQSIPWFRICCNISVNIHIAFHSKVAYSGLIVAILLCRLLSKLWRITALNQLWIGLLLVVRWSVGGCGETCEEAVLGFSGTDVQAVHRMEWRHQI